MPILEVEIVLKAEEVIDAGLPSEIANAAAAALEVRPGGTWVRLRTLSRERYAEGSDGPPLGVYPVFVTVLKADVPPTDQLAIEVGRLTQVIAAACDRPPQNVHILYQPAARGRIAFGGRLLE